MAKRSSGACLCGTGKAEGGLVETGNTKETRVFTAGVDSRAWGFSRAEVLRWEGVLAGVLVL
jgi:hypothetical protein